MLKNYTNRYEKFKIKGNGTGSETMTITVIKGRNARLFLSWSIWKYKSYDLVALGAWSRYGQGTLCSFQYFSDCDKSVKHMADKQA